MSKFDQTTSLQEARDIFFEQIIDEGMDCPCCDRWAKVYKRPISDSMAKGLVAAYKTFGAMKYGSLQEVRKQNDLHIREEAKLRFWDLLEGRGKGKDAEWRVTELGEQWILKKATVPKYAWIFDNELIGLSGPDTTIDDAMQEYFDYDALMKGF